MIDEKALERIADQASRMMAAGWRGNPHMSGDDRNFMSPSMRRRHDDKARTVVEFVLQALSPGSTGETDGWVLVPKEPTTKMLAAGQTAWLADPCRKSSTLYRAMLAAAGENE